MSIKLMSAILDAEFYDLEYTDKDGAKRKAKASTCKLVLLAIADHANDYGESAYPGYEKLTVKTALSRQGLSDTIDALVHNGLLLVDKRQSRIGTNNYTINVAALPAIARELPQVVKPLDSGESSHLTTLVKPLDQNLLINRYIDPVIAHMESLGMFPNSNTRTFLQTWREKHTDEWIIKALEKSKGKTQNYADKILLGWEANGYPKSREQEVAERRQGAPAKRAPEMGIYVPD